MPSSSSPSTTSSSSILSVAPHSPHLMERCIEQLHLDVPLISTRRASGSAHANKSCHLNTTQGMYNSTDTSRRVPFLWERAPGVPKDSVRELNSSNEEEVLTPKPPPGRWRPPNLNINNDNGNEGDVDDCSNDSNDDDASDALDKISLSEYLGITCGLSGLDGSLVSKDMGPNVHRAPSFIMDRFLPAATALAVASAYSNRRAHSVSRELTRPRPRLNRTTADAKKVEIGYGYGACAEAHPGSPSKACGLVVLFPWSLKRTLCGFKSPIRCQTPRLASLEAFTQRSKKFSSEVLSSDDGLSSKAWKSPGWGLPFLDSTSRLKTRGRSVDWKKVRGFMVERELECGGGRSPRRAGGEVVPESGRPPEWRSLPRLKSPSEPWLSHALNSVEDTKLHCVLKDL